MPTEWEKVESLHQLDLWPFCKSNCQTHRTHHTDNALPQKARVDVIGSLTTALKQTERQCKLRLRKDKFLLYFISCLFFVVDFVTYLGFPGGPSLLSIDPEPDLLSNSKLASSHALKPHDLTPQLLLPSAYVLGHRVTLIQPISMFTLKRRQLKKPVLSGSLSGEPRGFQLLLNSKYDHCLKSVADQKLRAVGCSPRCPCSPSYMIHQTSQFPLHRSFCGKDYSEEPIPEEYTPGLPRLLFAPPQWE